MRVGYVLSSDEEAGVSVFSYDADAPIELHEHGRETVEGVSVRDVSFASPKSGDVTAYLVVPSAEGQFPGVLFLHWGAGDRTEFLSDALVLANAGAVSLLVDAPHNRPGWQPFAFRMDPVNEREFYVQIVVELRRAVDVLDGLDPVDSGRVAFVGHSLGASVGGAFAGADDRVRAMVLMGGLPSPTPMPGTGEELAEAYREAFSKISSEALIGQASSDVLFQFARFDRHVDDASAKAYVEAATEPKEVRFYSTSHEFNDVASRRDRLAWIGEKLGLPPQV
jgi:dienelactone hydrolase